LDVPEWQELAWDQLGWRKMKSTEIRTQLVLQVQDRSTTGPIDQNLPSFNKPRFIASVLQEEPVLAGRTRGSMGAARLGCFCHFLCPSVQLNFVVAAGL
jgi:hypothetical protein